MPQVRYIGTCNKQDSIRGVGLNWAPGQSRNVTAEVAERLLVHTDTWEAAIAKPVAETIPVANEPNPVLDEPIGLTQEAKPAEEPLPVIDFHGMDKAALLNFAETTYNERLDKRQNEEAVRHKVISLFTQREMDRDTGDA